MADFKFTREEVDVLTDRLSTVATGLTKSEWTLLLAIFAAAVDQVKSGPDKTWGTLPAPEVNGNIEKVEDPRESTAEELREQLLQSYVPGGPPPPRPIVFRVTPPKHKPRP
jgi:hypothetical protein